MIRSKNNILLFLLAGLLFFAGEGWAKSKRVKVVGSAWLDGITEETALLLAKSEAKRRALEYAGRTAVASNTKVEDMMLVSDVVLTQTTGIITSMRWGKKWVENGKLNIELIAEIAAEKLDADFMAIEAALRDKGLPRIGMIISTEVSRLKGEPDERDLSVQPPYSYYEDALISGVKLYFMKITPDMDIKYLDPDEKFLGMRLGEIYQVSSGNYSRQGKYSRKQREQAAVDLSRELGLDMIVIGVVRIVVDEKFISGVEASSFNISPHLEIIQAGNNKTLALIDESFDTKPAFRAGAQKKLMRSLKRLGLREGRALMGQLIRHWCTNRGRVMLIVEGADQQILDRLKQDLKKLGGEQNVIVRSLHDGIGRIEFFSDIKRDELLNYLEELPDLEITVKSILEQEVYIKIDGVKETEG